MNNIFSINIDKSQANLIKLLDQVYCQQPAAVLIQDPVRISPDSAEMIDRLGYQIISDKRLNNLIMIRDQGPRREEITHETDISLGTKLNINGSKTMLISLYIRPRTQFTELERCLSQITTDVKAFGQKAVIIAGDTNATDPDWAPYTECAPELSSAQHAIAQMGDGHYRQIKRARGKQLASALRNLKLTCLNDPNTDPESFANTGEAATRSHIDVAYVGNKAARSWRTVTTEFIYTRHKLLVIKHHSKNTDNNQTQRTHRLQNISVNHFQALRIEFQALKHNLNNLNLRGLRDRADQMTSLISKHLMNAQMAVSKIVQLRRPRQTAPAKIRLELHRVINKLKKLESKQRRHRNNMQRASNRARATVLTRKINNLKSRATTLMHKKLMPIEQIQESDLWTRVNTVRQNTSMRAVEQILSRAEIEAIADEKFGSSFIQADRPEIETLFSAQTRLSISTHETRTALQMNRNKKFTGPEGLKYETLTRAAQFIEDILHTWCHTCFSAAYTPKVCKNTTGVIIPKKTPGKFRIVHIGSPLTSLLERIALSRFEHALERNSLYNDRQFGFCACIDRHDLITRVLESVIKNTLSERSDTQPKYTTIISFDIKGAFDNVDQAMIQQKLTYELADDAISVWLANFTQNRKIQLKSGEMKAAPRTLSKGVPQGSILGPTLWNYAISNLDIGITRPETGVEVLAYADDLILVYLGDNYELLQEQVDKLNQQVKALKLEIEPQKCSIIRMRYDRKRNQPSPNLDLTPNITIDNQPITKTGSLSILGVPITHQLRLDLDSCKDRISAGAKARLLNTIKRFDIVHTSKDWSILINSYLNSTIINNYLPLLAIDIRGRSWCDKTMCRALKHTFDWPNNASNKVVRTICSTIEDAESLAHKAISVNTIKPNSGGYRTLRELMRANGDLNIMKATTSLLQNTSLQTIEPIRLFNRRYHSPTLNNITKLTEYKSISDMCEKEGPVWIAIESGKVAVASEIINATTILQTRIARHTEFAVGYFNLMGLLWDMAGNQSYQTKKLIFSPGNSVLQALRNMSNHDWRIIELREKLALNKWEIALLQHEVHELIKNLVMSKSAAQLTNVTIHNQDMVWVTWPPTDDYQRRNNITKTHATTTASLAKENLSRLMLHLSEDAMIWDNINPGWTSGKTMLMLSGMVRTVDGLIKGDLQPLETPVGCPQDTCMRERLEETHTNRHSTLHRAFHCPRFADKRPELNMIMNWAISEELGTRAQPASRTVDRSIRNPWRYPRAIEITLSNRRYAQSLLRILTEVAMTQ